MTTVGDMRMATESLQSEMDQSLKAVKNAEATGSKEEDIDSIPYLCGKPFFDVVLTKSHVDPKYIFHVPVKMHCQLPRATVPAVLRCKRTNWNLSYHGKSPNPRLGNQWREFAIDNDLAVGDACVFELMECSCTGIMFKVHILRGNLPAELQASVDSRGMSWGNPIVVD